MVNKSCNCDWCQQIEPEIDDESLYIQKFVHRLFVNKFLDYFNFFFQKSIESLFY